MPFLGPSVRRFLLPAIGMCLFAAPSVSGQQTGEVPRLPLAPLRLAAISQTSEACGSAVSAAAVQKNFEGRLRSAGITVSAIHNAQIAMSLDCLALQDSAGAAAVAVHQCLAYSEVVSVAREGKPILASTWQNCQSYTCRTGKCDSQTSSATGTLMNAFLTELQQRTQAEATQFVPVLTYNPPPRRNVIQFLFYTVFMMACLSVLFYWQWRKPRDEARRAV